MIKDVSTIQMFVLTRSVYVVSKNGNYIKQNSEQTDILEFFVKLVVEIKWNDTPKLYFREQYSFLK